MGCQVNAGGWSTAIGATISLLVMDHVMIWPTPSPLRILPASAIPFALEQILLNGTLVRLSAAESEHYSWRVSIPDKRVKGLL